MTQSDAYYRALAAYRAAVGEKRECVRDSKAVIDTIGTEKLCVTRINCTVDEEWVQEIEKGLVFIEKAIKEERQFIYSNGEVVPIEKVKHVSRDSVEHLAKHSDLITRMPEGEDIIPDKLYTVERYSDYTVYENRFLYMLLCYLRDFVTLRYQDILTLTNKYEGSLSVHEVVTVHGRTVRFDIDMQDERRDDPYLREHNPAKPLIDRMDLILKAINAYLATPLMESAGKAPMLKPPITKTNVLKMDNNFKGAVALYEYIIAYEGKGYDSEEQTKEISPFLDGVAEDMAEAELLLSFITYKHGLELEDMLKAAKEIDEEKARQEELRRKTGQIEKLRRRLESEGRPIEEYIFFLERQVRTLQNEVNRSESLTDEIGELKENAVALGDTIRAQDAEREALEDRIAGFEGELEQRLDEQKQSYTEELAEARRAHTEELMRISKEHKASEDELKRQIEKQKRDIENLTALRAALEEQNTLLTARLTGMRYKRGEITKAEKMALTEKKDFDELEKQLDAFVEFYQKEWKLAKRKIRKDLINLKNIKGQGKK